MALTTPEQLPSPEPAAPVSLGSDGHRAGVFRVFSNQTLGLRIVTMLAALVPLGLLGFILVVLWLKAYPAIRINGVGFVTRKSWDLGLQNPPFNHPNEKISFQKDGITVPLGASYGALPLILGTVGSSVIALLFAVPVSVGAALAIVEKLPRRLSNAMGMFLEVLAGIPSVVFGLWGALTFGPILARDVAPIIANHMPDVPVLSFFRGNTGYGEGLLTTGLVLGIMIIPIVAATTRDLLRQVPRLPKEGASALGMTEFEVIRTVNLPWIRAGLIGASVLGLARALGETMAVAMVSGAVTGALPQNLYLGMDTIAANIVNELDSAFSNPLELATLAELALVLALITLMSNVGARLLVRRTSGAALPVGRGL